MTTTATVETGDSRRLTTVVLMSLLAALLLVASATSFAYAGEPKDKAQIFAITTEGPEPVTGSLSMFERDANAVHTKVRTQIDGGHAYTLWWMIFNNPDACDGPCGEDDIFVNPEAHEEGFRFDQIAATQVSVVWGGGAIANPAGRLKLDVTLHEDEPPQGERQILIGTEEGGAFAPIGVVDGLTNAQGAEFMVILQDHGHAREDPTEQLTMFLGGCNPEPADFTVFPPDPGSCADVQFAVHR